MSGANGRENRGYLRLCFHQVVVVVAVVVVVVECLCDVWCVDDDS